MGLQQSKDEILYQQASYGNVELIKALRQNGAGLEYIDREGKTPLILACMKPDGLQVAKTLIELGANVNAYRPGYHGGTPLHHAAKKGLEQTVNLLISHGANVFRLNDDCQTALDLARAKCHMNVVRAIENRICLFAGWLRELYGPGFLEALAPQWVSRKIWAVVLPCDHRNQMNLSKCELAIYPEQQVAQPRVIVDLWKAKIEETDFNQPDPVVIIFDKSTKTRYKFLSANEGDKQQLMWFYNACKGISQQAVPVSLGPSPFASAIPATAPAPASSLQDEELAMAINASIQTAQAEQAHRVSVPQDTNTGGWGDTDNSTSNGWGQPIDPSPPAQATNGWANEPADDSYNGWTTSNPAPQGQQLIDHVAPAVASPIQDIPPVTSAPPVTSVVTSAPPAREATFSYSFVHYPSIDMGPVDSASPVTEMETGSTEIKKGSGASATCVICLDSPVEGACIPCGHMAGCMCCLNEIKAKKWGCPVCRSKIDQVVRLYSV